MGSVDLVPYWQVIVVTPETVIASIELAGIIMQVRTHTLNSTCLLRRRDAAVQRWETAAQAVTGAQYADYRITALGYDITGG